MLEPYRGLVAQTYDLWFPPDTPFRDEPFFRRRIEGNGGAALEIGSGTGRLLLPYLKAGLPVEGLESSPDMLAICREKAARAGLTPVLHEQRMEALTIDKLYRTIFVPLASIQLLEHRAHALEALRRFHAHLEPGGELIVTLFLPWKEMEAKGSWQMRRAGELGGDTVVLSEAISSDRIDQSQIWWLRYDIFRAGELLRSELHTSRVRWYYRAEFELMLEKCGFREILALADFDERQAGGASDIIFLARA